MLCSNPTGGWETPDSGTCSDASKDRRAAGPVRIPARGSMSSSQREYEDRIFASANLNGSIPGDDFVPADVFSLIPHESQADATFITSIQTLLHISGDNISSAL